MLNDIEKIKFRKYYLRKVKPHEPDVVILQDIKDLVLFLLTTPVSPQFINFFHLPIVDRFLRALILYFQHYVEIWEDLMQERAATMRKAPNPLARGHRTRYAEEMRTLRCVLGREYVDLIMGCQGGAQYHHMMTGEKRSAVTQSQGEKDLRVFEALTSVAHRVVWIALQRKHYNLIELELHRLLRTEAYNTAQRQSSSQIIQDMLEDDIRILHGPKMALKSKLLRNSPLPHELMYSDCDYRLLSLGIVEIDARDPKIAYLKNALLIEEDKLSQLGIRVGILGHNRSNYDIMLKPSETEESELIEISMFEKKAMELRKSIPSDKISDIKERIERGLSPRKSEYELVEKFPVKEIEVPAGRYDKVRKEARRKWIVREVKRRHGKPFDIIL
ncbi:protein phosphatase 1 regulatory subunit 36-like isoform X2 [Linepithema humile]